MNLNQVTLPVSDIKKASRFYRQLGFTQIVDSEKYARFECPDGGSSFSLSRSNEAFNNTAIVYFESKRLNRWIDELIDRGIDIHQMPTNQSYLWREAILFDPSGNKIKLYHAAENRLNPPWRVHKTWQNTDC